MGENKKINLLSAKDAYELLAPNKHKVFFGAAGITTTSASHYAELIKANALSIHAEFGKTNAYHGIMDFKGKDVEIDLYSEIDLEGLATKEGEMYALSAWFREAVKAKDELLKIFKTIQIESFLPENTLPVFTEIRPSPPFVTQPKMLKTDDILGDLNIADRAEYYTVEAKAAHLGIKIHPKGVIYNIKNDLEKGRVTGFKALPDGVGESTYLVQYEELYDLEQITSIYFRLQEQHRAAEARLNHFKALLQNGVTDGNAKLQQEYSAAARASTSKYQKELDIFHAKVEAYNAEVDAINSDVEKLRFEVIKYVSQLKVVIPKDLEHIIKEIADLSA